MRKRRKYAKMCEGCGTGFETATPQTRFCSIRCSKVGDKNPNWRGVDFKNTNKISLICENCGISYIPTTLKTNRERRFCTISCSKMGARNNNWNDGGVSYAGVHNWARRAVSKPELCQECKIEKPRDIANISDEYKKEASDWEWLCRRCHMKKDGRMNNLKQNKTQQPCSPNS